MKLNKYLAVFSLCSAMLMMPAVIIAAGQVEAIDGRYLTEGGFVEVAIRPCNLSSNSGARCGRITRILKRKRGESDRDAHNANPALRSRPIKGITLLTDLRLKGDVWRGKVYNPEDGRTYRAEVRTKSGGAIEVKGCLAFICQGRIWPAVG